MSVKYDLRDGQFATTLDMFAARVRQSPYDVAYQYLSAEGDVRQMQWETADRIIDEIACGLLMNGVVFGDRVGVISTTRLDAILIDFAINRVGAISVQISPRSSQEAVAHILQDSGCKLVFVENRETFKKSLALDNDLTANIPAIIIDGPLHSGSGLIDLRVLGRENEGKCQTRLAEIAAQIMPDTICALVYTSGTTGNPKGVIQTHGNLTYSAWAQQQLGWLDKDDANLLWLPLDHVFGRLLTASHVQIGYVSAVVSDPRKLGEYMGIFRPTVVAAVPKLFGVMIDGINSGVKKQPAYKRWLFSLAMGSARRQLRRDQRCGRGYHVPSGVLVNLAFKQIWQRFGGRMRFFISGGAALPVEYDRFMRWLGVSIQNGYGLTETCGGVAIVRASDYTSETVGRPLEGTIIKIASPEGDRRYGEVLIKGPSVTPGYWNNPEKTAEAIDPDGWYHTGDTGEIDEDGNLHLHGRLKDSVKTAGSEYVKPPEIEAKLVAQCHPYVEQALVVAEGRSHCAAVIFLNKPSAMRWLISRGEDGSYEAAVTSQSVREMIQGYIDALNGRLSAAEKIRGFAIASRELDPEIEMTAKGDIKRHVVTEAFAAEIEAMYA
jgi:long-chain acyl-CoA synthetase